MKFFYSLKFRLLTIFLLCMLVPSIFISIITASYFERVLTTETNKLTTSTITSISENITTYLDDLERLTMVPYMHDKLMNAITLKAKGKYNELDAYTRLNVDKSLYFTMPDILQNTRKDILSCVLLTFDNTLFATYKYDGITRTYTNYPFKETEWYQQAMKADGKVVFVGSHTSDYLNLPKNPNVFSVARLIKEPDTNRPLAIIMADASDLVLNKIISKIDFSVSSISLVLDDKNKILYSNYPVNENIVNEINNDPEFIVNNNKTYVVSKNLIDSCGWKIVVLSSYSEIRSRVGKIFGITILFSILCIAIAFILYSIFSSRIMKPIENIMSTMKKVEKGDLSTKLKITGKDEVAELELALNHMIEKLNDLIDREFKAVINQRNAEYQALQSQIQPHFLYNTLTGFIGLNRIGDRDGLENSIFSLTNMLRYILEQDEWTNIEKEFLFIKDYCDLQKIRFDDRANIHTYYDKTVAYYKIPKLILQPLVENSIIHGLEPLDRVCKIEIIANLVTEQNSNFLKLIIKDNGAGFDMNNDFIKPNIGLSNVIERLKIAYKNHTFNVYSEPNKGTKIIIKIPQNEVLQ